MIVNRPTNTTLETNVSGDRIEMSVDQGAMAHIMRLLTDLYSDPERAIIREYATNGRDSHIEAGCGDRPIEVSLPGALNPVLKIRDYGVGLDAEGIRAIYSQYGASTKRHTNDQNGMLGLGCKSALTYTNQFSLVGVKDGKATTVVIQRDENGVGSMTPAQVLDTDEPNGVTVSIPIKRQNDIPRKAVEFFRGWDEGTVLIDGKPPKGFDGLPVGDNMVVIEGSQDYVVMGNVTYPVESGKIKHGMTQRRWNSPEFGLVAFVSIGEVNFAPSREALMYDSVTDTTLQRLGHEFQRNIDGAIQSEMDKAPDAAQAIETMIRWRQIMQGNAAMSYTYKDQNVPVKWDNNGDSILSAPVGGGRNYRDRVGGKLVSSIEAEAWPTTLFVYNYPGAKLSGDQRRKLQVHLANQGSAVEAAVKRFVLVSKFNKLPWFAHTVDYMATIRPMKLSPTQVRQSSGRIPGSYDVYDAQDGYLHSGMAANDLDQNRPIYYDGNGKHAGRYNAFLASQHPDCYIVQMVNTRVEKFKRDFPRAVEAYEGVKSDYETWQKGVKRVDLLSIACGKEGDREFLKSLDASKVDDPAIRRGIATAKRDVTKVARERQAFESFFGGLDKKLPVWDTPVSQEDYPLIRERLGGFVKVKPRHEQHIYTYINAAYAAKTKED